MKKRGLVQQKLFTPSKIERSSKSFESGNSHGRAACPICNLSVSKNMIDIHVDACLQKAEDKVNEISAIEETTYKIEKHSEVPGVWIIHDFITPEEAGNLVALLDDADNKPSWGHSSFSGHCFSKNFGFIMQFGLNNEKRCVRQNNEDKGECNMPAFLADFPKRLRKVARQRDDLPYALRTFEPNECNANSYYTSKQHFLRPHFDDRTLSGPILMNLSLLCPAFMTYYKSPVDPSAGTSNSTNGSIVNHDNETKVLLPPNALQLVTGPARWTYQHGMRGQDILGERRVSLTFRQAGV